MAFFSFSNEFFLPLISCPFFFATLSKRIFYKFVNHNANMKPFSATGKPLSLINIDAVCEIILKTQKKTGEIPWHEGGKTDPWDHIEAAMGLSVGGHFERARRAFEWLAAMQLDDGSWPSAYCDGKPRDETRDSNMSSYIAAGLFHYCLATDDIDFLEKMWETVRRAIEFALGMQGAEGEIFWAKNPAGQIDHMALLTGSSSVFFSVKCAMAIAKKLGHDISGWKNSLERLKKAINEKPYLFNATKSRYSMDWFYPVLSGAVVGKAAEERINRRWKKYIVNGQGVLCVADEPWVTIAETSELVLTLSAMGNRELAGIIFDWIADKIFEDGSFWCGYTYPDMTVWSEEKMTWTNGVALIAADALFNLTPASSLFSHASWDPVDFSFRFEKSLWQNRVIDINTLKNKKGRNGP